MYKLKYISLLTFLMFAGGLYAQSDSAKQDQEGEIVMTQQELKDFLQSVADAKLKRMEAQREMDNKLKLAEAKAYYYEQLSKQQAYRGYPNQGYYYGQPQNQQSQADLLFEIERLNGKVNYLLGKLNESANNQGSTTTVVAPEGQAAPAPSQNNQQLSDLQKKLDSLQKQVNTELTTDVNDMKSGFAELNNRLKNASKEERRSLLEELLKKYGNFKKQVFFANNSSKVPNSDMDYINEVVDVLKSNPELSVVLEGYASPVGSPTYNKQLSMRRAEAVQEVLVSKGISSAKIVAAFKGEDHSGSAEHARRVDMSIVIK